MCGRFVQKSSAAETEFSFLTRTRSRVLCSRCRCPSEGLCQVPVPSRRSGAG